MVKTIYVKSGFVVAYVLRVECQYLGWQDFFWRILKTLFDQ